MNAIFWKEKNVQIFASEKMQLLFVVSSVCSPALRKYFSSFSNSLSHV